MATFNVLNENNYDEMESGIQRIYSILTVNQKNEVKGSYILKYKKCC